MAAESSVLEVQGALLPVGQDFLMRELEAARLTVTALASELGVSRKHASGLLHGQAPMTPAMAAGIAGILPVALEEIMALTIRDQPSAEIEELDLRVAVLGNLTEPSEDWEEA